LICGLKKRENKIQLQANKINGRHSYVIEYYNKARAGTEALKLASSDIKAQVAKGEIIVIGQELRQALENIIDDLENPEWYYDTADAELRQEFIETFCRHTKSPFYGQPFILELWEKAVIEAFYSFKSVATRQRRFKKCILLIARKKRKVDTLRSLGINRVNG
jgi:hypothetical protein